ncbi:hypothetical protein HDV57DRAFT_443308 [Trichoderma longibrachiatum]|uniref:Uncharacterized protein n=1 Tax=Trichoderma longibrachiatum ATCC 18648 TaxID=983965 RepID=A0A2T4CG30_TRILO|nr:hypothetical protein M440DRAFT_195982 [Trichoderma longibrachiatum ATCC 18648]
MSNFSTRSPVLISHVSSPRDQEGLSTKSHDPSLSAPLPSKTDPPTASQPKDGTPQKPSKKEAQPMQGCAPNNFLTTAQTSLPCAKPKTEDASQPAAYLRNSTTTLNCGYPHSTIKR